MKLRHFLHSLLFVHITVAVCLIPIGAGVLICSMLLLDDTSPLRIASYIAAFYALLVWCLRAPRIIRFFASLKRRSRLISSWGSDVRIRINITLGVGVTFNTAYAALLLGMGIRHRSAWFCTLAAYYVMLAAMRYFLVRHTLRHRPGEHMQRELKYYRACAVIFLIMNIALSAMMLIMIRENGAARHHEITTIAMAAYTFTALTLAAVNVVKYRKYNSPAMSAAKAVSLAAACVSMLTLENTMLSTFGSGSMSPQTRVLFLSLSGGAVSALIIAMAIYMLVKSSNEMKKTEARYGKPQNL